MEWDVDSFSWGCSVFATSVEENSGLAPVPTALIGDIYVPSSLRSCEHRVLVILADLETAFY